MNGEHPGKAVSPALQTGALHLPLENLDALTAAQYQAAVDALAPRLAGAFAHGAVAQLPAVSAGKLPQRLPIEHQHGGKPGYFTL